MAGTPRIGRVRRRARRRLRLLLPARLGLVLGVLALPVAFPGVAAAATVTPVLDCVIPEPSGGFTAVIGYSNASGETVDIPHGPDNNVTPTPYDGGQPTSFLAGEQRGAFSVVIDHPSVKWRLDGTTLAISEDGPPCQPPTEMPEEGNGTGAAIGVTAAGLAGAVFVQRMRRRLAAATAAPQNAGAGPEGHRA